MASSQELLGIGMQHHQAGQLPEAVACYQEILKLNPEHPDALHLLGLAAHQSGQISVAYDLIRQAISLNATNPHYYNNFANVLLDLGQRQEALTMYENAIKLDRNYLDALLNYGLVLLDLNRTEDAIQQFKKCLRIQRNFPEAYNALGNACKAQQNYTDAISNYETALKLNPRYPEALFNLGVCYHEQRDLEKAIETYRKTLALAPNLFQVHTMLGKALKEKGDLAEALSSYERSLALNPEVDVTHSNYANALAAEGDYKKALSHYRKALELNPDFADALYNMGNVLLKEGDVDEALNSYYRSIELKPDNPLVYCNLGQVYQDQGRYEDAHENYRKAVALMPEPALWRLKIDTLCPVSSRFESVEAMDRFRAQVEETLETYLDASETTPLRLDPEELVNSGGHLSFFYPYQGRNDCAMRSKYASLIYKSLPREKTDLPVCSDYSRIPKIAEIPKIGFIVSADHEKGFCTIMGGVVQQLSREKFDIRVVCAESGVGPIQQALTLPEKEMVGFSGTFEAVIEKIRAEQFDLVFYFEVGTDAFNYFLPYFRLAPVQCTSWGFPVTTGIPNMDYFISSDLMEPDDAKSHYSETLVRFQTLPIYFEKPMLTGAPKTRADFGLPDKTRLYACPQNLVKFHPEFTRYLADILRKDPEGEILLIESVHEKITELLKDRFEKEIPDVSARIRFMQRIPAYDFMHLITLCDVMLDTLHFGGGMSTYEAFAVGMPVVTQPGAFMKGRATMAMYQKMGITECIAGSREEYATLAVSIAGDPTYRKALGEKILSANHVLYSDTMFIRELELFFDKAIQKNRSGNLSTFKPVQADVAVSATSDARNSQEAGCHVQ